MANSENGEKSALVVHLSCEKKKYSVPELSNVLKDCSVLLKIDGSTNNKVVKTTFGNSICFEGYGVAVITTRVAN